MFTAAFVIISFRHFGITLLLVLIWAYLVIDDTAFSLETWSFQASVAVLLFPSPTHAFEAVFVILLIYFNNCYL